MSDPQVPVGQEIGTPRRRTTLPALLVLAVAACAPAEETAEEKAAATQEYAAASADVRGAYEAFVRARFAAFNNRDTAALLSLYAADAIRMPPAAPAERGPEAIRSSFEETFRSFSELRAQGASQQVHFADDWAMERGSYTLTGTRAREPRQEVIERGKYVVVARMGADGAWKILWQIWSPNTPEPEPGGDAPGGAGGDPGGATRPVEEWRGAGVRDSIRGGAGDVP